MLSVIAAVEVEGDRTGDEAGSGAEAPQSEAGSIGRAQPVRILVVEDDYLVALTICDLLSGAGYEVLGPAVSGEEAIGVALEALPDLVLMDIRLAGDMDGVDAALELARSGIRSLFVSAHSDPLTRSRGDAASPYGWVEKPFTDTQLLNAVADTFT